MVNECPDVFDCLNSFEDIITICPYDAVCGKCQHWVEPHEEGSLLRGHCLKKPASVFFYCAAQGCDKYILRGSRVYYTKIPEVFNMERNELKDLLREILDETLGMSDVQLGKKWEGGEIILRPGNKEVSEKTIPVEAFFHKIVMLRDRLRVLEQKINAHNILTDEEKVDLQQYITKIYGSLTTFNILFADKEDQFIGEKGKG